VRARKEDITVFFSMFFAIIYVWYLSDWTYMGIRSSVGRMAVIYPYGSAVQSSSENVDSNGGVADAPRNGAKRCMLRWCRADIDFVEALLEHVSGNYPFLDVCNAMAVGFSVGACMAVRAGERLRRRFRAVAAVEGCVPPRIGVAASAWLPLFLCYTAGSAWLGRVNWTTTVLEDDEQPVSGLDSIAAWTGRGGAVTESSRGRVESTLEWQPVPSGDDPTKDRPCKHRATLTRFEQSDVLEWKLEGCGHVWPGAPPYAVHLLGPSTQVLDASQAIVDFFVEVTRRPSAAPASANHAKVAISGSSASVAVAPRFIGNFGF
jgi:poly(3-hydroxybutyrate) depolymerase